MTFVVNFIIYFVSCFFMFPIILKYINKYGKKNVKNDGYYNKNIETPLFISIILISPDIYNYTHQIYFVFFIALGLYFCMPFIYKETLTKVVCIRRTIRITCIIIVWVLLRDFLMCKFF